VKSHSTDKNRGSIHYWTYRGTEVKLLLCGLTWAVIQRLDGSAPFVVGFDHLV
jgi:hypothetical protein